MPAWIGALVRLAVALGASTAIILAAGWVLGVLAAPLALADHPAVAETIVDLLIFGLLALVALVALRVARERVAIGPASKGAAGVALGVGGLSAALALAAVAGVAGRGDSAMSGGALIALGTVLTLGQTGVEELVFRGWLQPGLQHGWGRWPGLFAGAAAFAMLHLVGGGMDLSTLPAIALAGVWFGLLADRSGGLAMPIGAHFGWNWAEELLFGAAPNPGVGSFGTLFDVDLIGPRSWSGNEQGLNASLAAVFVLAALTILAALWPARHSARRAFA